MSEAQDPIQEENNESLYERSTFVVDKGQAPTRIDKWVQVRIEGITRNKLQNGIDAGFLTVNGKVVKSNYKTRPGDEVVYLSIEKWKKNIFQKKKKKKKKKIKFLSN